MRPRTNLKAAAVAAIVTTPFLVGVVGSGSPASALQPDHLVVLAGSSHRLVYADYPVTANNHPIFTAGDLHVRSANGSDRNLGGDFGDVDPKSAAPYSFSIIKSTITAYSTADPSHVEWWDLSTHTSGVGSLPAGARWQGSAPDGWVYVAADNETVGVETTTGAITLYGQPVPGETTAGGVVDAISGDDGVVSVGQRSDQISYQRWNNPSSVRSLDVGEAAGSTDLSCADASGAIAGCTYQGIDDTRPTELAVPLDGSPPRGYAGCGADPVAYGPKLVWVCGTRHAHPHFGSVTSTSARSSKQVAPLTGVSALGSFVTAGPLQQEIVGLTTAHRKAKVIVSIPSPIVRFNATNLRLAARAVAAAAVAGHALDTAPTLPYPAQVLQASSDALILAARAKDPALVPKDTRSVMGGVPKALRHRSHRRPHHRHIRATHSLERFSHAVPDSGSAGVGVHAHHGGNVAAPFLRPDGVYVYPHLAMPENPTVGMVALRAALLKLGSPYVWAAGGPSTFDCSGLVQWAYAHAGRHFTHFSGAQWNEARLISPRDILPGDLILFDHLVNHHEVIHHVGLYLGAGWMLNAPFTGQYVNVVRVSSGVAGVVRP
jgi:cell wall-associated NlpC family hydrolase